MTADVVYWGELDTPVGTVAVSVNDDGAVVRVLFARASGAQHDHAREAARQLAEYFRGERRAFDLELLPVGTEFEKRVWAEVMKLAYGKTASYGEIADRLGGATVARAVGSANAANPIAILIPCHRVVGAAGELTGYAGGLWRKRWLLEMESGQARLFE